MIAILARMRSLHRIEVTRDIKAQETVKTNKEKSYKTGSKTKMVCYFKIQQMVNKTELQT
jgi:hypothetical protein